jgi:hypothetical protein
VPRKNKRKSFTKGKTAVFFNGVSSNGDTPGDKPECIGCAFAGFGNVCKTSDGICLLSAKKQP